MSERKVRFLGGWVEPNRIGWVSYLNPTYANRALTGVYMNRRRITDLFQIDSSKTLLNEVLVILDLISSDVDSESVGNIFNVAEGLYNGNYPGYSACTTDYHDLNHAHNVFLAMARMIHGAVCEGQIFSQRQIVLGMMAAILHDAGYIQKDSDREGTGAKYTAVHEKRSMDFLARHGEEFGLSADEIAAGCSIILCTDIDNDISKIAFPSAQIELLGRLLASADLLAQLSDQNYLEKLLFLYYEYKEAGDGNFKSEFDMLKKAVAFYEFSEHRLQSLLHQAGRFMQSHFAARCNISKNLYQDAIKRHQHYLFKVLSTKDSDHRKYLRRSGIVQKVRCKYRTHEAKDRNKMV